MYKCIIIDDEERGIKVLTDYIQSFSNFVITNSFTDPLKALKEISLMPKVDAIFMDVDMPGISGIELSKALRSKTDKLIFTTAHSRYAIDAFEVDGDAFLLKPYTFAKFALAVNKLFPKQEEAVENLKNDTYFFVKNKEENLDLVKVFYSDIIAIESLQNYVQFYTTKGKIVAYFSLKEIINILKDREEFVQIQRSYIISVLFIDRLNGNVVVLNGNIKVTIGNNYRENLLDIVKNKILKTGRK